MSLDHVGFAVADFARSRAFYTAALGVAVTAEGEGWAMLGRDGRPEFWFGAPDVGGKPPGRIHLAFAATERARVDAFHAAAMAASGRDNGELGLRPQYHANDYAAFVIDPDGHNIEAVCHAPGAAEDQRWRPR